MLRGEEIRARVYFRVLYQYVIILTRALIALCLFKWELATSQVNSPLAKITQHRACFSGQCENGRPRFPSPLSLSHLLTHSLCASVSHPLCEAKQHYILAIYHVQSPRKSALHAHGIHSHDKILCRYKKGSTYLADDESRNRASK